MSHRHYPSSPILFLSGCLGQPAVFPGAVPALCQGFICSFLLSAEDSDTQSPDSEDQQVSLPCAIQAGEKVGPSNLPLTHQLLPHLHTACILSHGASERLPCAMRCQTQAGDLLAYGVHCRVRIPHCSSALTKDAPTPRAVLQGV